MRRLALVVAVGALAAGVAALTRDPVRVQLHLNEIQVVGTHNSYHRSPSGALYRNAAPRLSSGDLDYEHAALPVQLSEQSIRQLEFDVWADPLGTRWSPIGVAGFKVFHAPNDTGSICAVLVECLRELRSWSRAHPQHLPVAVMIEPRDGNDTSSSNVVPITTAMLDRLDAEIRSVLGPDQLLTPDDVRGRRATLESAVRRDGWPTLDAVRGRFVFLLSGRRAAYIVGHESLEGRVMFTPSRPGQPDAAFVKVDDPRGANTPKVRDLVRRGYLVRTRADSPVATPKSGDVAQRRAAFSSGAQWVSTDYPVAGLAEIWRSDYFAALPGPGGVARCNPVSAPVGCDRSQLDEAGPVRASAPSLLTPPLRGRPGAG